LTSSDESGPVSYLISKWFIPLLLFPVFAINSLYAANETVVKRLLEKEFYDVGALTDVDSLGLDDLLTDLKTRNIDPWVEVFGDSKNDSLIAKAENEGYGLQLIAQDDRFYFVSVPDGPNGENQFTAYEILNPPDDGDWAKALDSGTLKLRGQGGLTILSSMLSKSRFTTTDVAFDGEIIRIDNFTNRSQAYLFNQLSNELSSARIVDLRFNGGGSMDYASNFLSAFLGADIPVGYVDRREDRVYFGPEKTSSELALRDITVLVSRHTASAAEWVASVLQSYGAKVIGERSTGKCLLHGVFPAGKKQFVSFAIGKIGVSNIASYDYCTFGLIPDTFLNPDILVLNNSATLVEVAANCLQSKIQKEGKDSSCKGLADLTTEFNPFSGRSNSIQLAVDIDSSQAGAEGPSLDESVLGGHVARTESPDVNEPSHVQLSNESDRSDIVDKEAKTHFVCVAREYKLQLVSYESENVARTFLQQVNGLDLPERATYYSVERSGKRYFRVLFPVIKRQSRALEIKKLVDTSFAIESEIHFLNKSNAFLNHLSLTVDTDLYEFVLVGRNQVCTHESYTLNTATENAQEFKSLSGLQFETLESRNVK